MKLQKTTVSLILAVMLVLSSLSLLPAAAVAAPANFDVVNGIAVKYVGTATVVTADMFTAEGVTVIGSSAFRGTDVTEVTMPNTITAIGTGSFAECTMLQKVTLSNAITRIPNRAFENCASLKNITI